jgi:hypothetical protein
LKKTFAPLSERAANLKKSRIRKMTSQVVTSVVLTHDDISRQAEQYRFSMILKRSGSSAQVEAPKTNVVYADGLRVVQCFEGL